jgi:hypothetical protein
MSRLTQLFRFGKGPVARRTAIDRRRRFAVETLEGRQLLTLNIASAFGVGGTVSVSKIALDTQGDTYATGTFTGQVDFDPNGTGGNVLNAGVTPTAFVAEYSPANTLVWVKDFAPSAGGSSHGTALAVNSTTGSVYVVGSFSGTVNFATSGSPHTVTSIGTSDGFIAELTSSGNLDSGLVRHFGGTGSDSATAVTLSADGQSVYVTGSFINTANFDPGGTNKLLTTPVAGETDAFALKLSSNLGFDFAQNAGLAGAAGDAIAGDSQGNVYVVGSDVTGAAENAFLTKFNSIGSLEADKLFGGPASGGTSAIALGLVVDSTDNVYVSGFFSGTGVNFNKFNSPGTVALDSAGASDAFLIKVDPSLELVWARRFGSAHSDSGIALGIDGNNNIYMAGFEEGQSSFGTTGPGTTVLDTGNGITGTPDAYVLEVDSSGNFVQATGAGGTGASVAESIAVNGSGEVGFGGLYTAPATFGNTTLSGLGAEQFFIATLNTNNGSAGGGGGGGGGGDPGPVSAPPTFVAEVPVFVGQGKHKRIAGFELIFSAALDATNAENVAHYQVTQPGKKGKTSIIPVLTATYSSATNAVTLTLGNFNQKKPLQLTATGLTGSSGAAVATVVTIL